MRRWLTGLALLVLCASAHAEHLVVVAKDSPIDSLSKKQVENIFLAKTRSLDDGTRVIPIELADTLTREHFYHSIAGKSLSQINSYWTTLIFTGKGKPPREYKDKRHLLEALKTNIYAVTYLPVDLVGDGMKVVYTLD